MELEDLVESQRIAICHHDEGVKRSTVGNHGGAASEQSHVPRWGFSKYFLLMMMC